MPGRILLLFLSRHDNAYSLNAIAGAVESAATLAGVETEFAKSLLEAEEKIDRFLLQGCCRVIVAWSFCSADFSRRSKELKRLKKRFPHAPILHFAGGPHPSAEPEQTLTEGFDYVAVGEGERTAVTFLEALLRGEDTSTLPGISTRVGDRILHNGKGEEVDLDAFPPFPLRHNRFQPLEITRGCPFACRYCQISYLFSPRFRHRSVEAVGHWARIMKRAGLRDIRFVSPSSLSYGSNDRTLRLESVGRLLETVRSIVGNRGKIYFGTFPSEVRPEHVTRESLRLLKAYVDNDNLLIGAQAGTDRLLEACHRGHTLEQAVTAVRLALEYGFKPQVDIIFGLPGEKTEEAYSSLQLAENLAGWGARIHAHTFMPLPGTPWKKMPPGNLEAAIQRRLKQMAAEGQVFGKWEGQIRTARTLSHLQGQTK